MGKGGNEKETGKNKLLLKSHYQELLHSRGNFSFSSIPSCGPAFDQSIGEPVVDIQIFYLCIIIGFNI